MINIYINNSIEFERSKNRALKVPLCLCINIYCMYVKFLRHFQRYFSLWPSSSLGLSDHGSHLVFQGGISSQAEQRHNGCCFDKKLKSPALFRKKVTSKMLSTYQAWRWEDPDNRISSGVVGRKRDRDKDCEVFIFGTFLEGTGSLEASRWVQRRLGTRPDSQWQLPQVQWKKLPEDVPWYGLICVPPISTYVKP